jgi:hypothetical protein
LETERDANDFQFHIAQSRSAKLGFCLEKIVEFQVSHQGFIPIGACVGTALMFAGTKLNASHFVPGQFIDVQSRSYGFAS